MTVRCEKKETFYYFLVIHSLICSINRGCTPRVASLQSCEPPELQATRVAPLESATTYACGHTSLYVMEQNVKGYRLRVASLQSCDPPELRLGRAQTRMAEKPPYVDSRFKREGVCSTRVTPLETWRGMARLPYPKAERRQSKGGQSGGQQGGRGYCMRNLRVSAVLYCSKDQKKLKSLQKKVLKYKNIAKFKREWTPIA